MSGLIVTANLSFGNGLKFQAGIGGNGLGVQETVPGYDVVLLAGQSNIIGLYGPINPLIDTGNVRILQYANSGPSVGTIIAGIDALYHPLQAPNTVGPGMSFARTYLPNVGSNRSLVLVPYGVSNSGFENGSGVTAGWQVGGSLYLAAIAACNAVMASGTGTNRFLGIVWLQGEASAMLAMPGGNQAWYQDSMLAGMRAAITGASDSWFVNIGMNQEYFATGDATAGPGAYETIEAVLANTPLRVLRTAYVAGAAGSGADIHFNAAGSRANGVAAAGALSSLSSATALPGIPTGLTSTATTSASVSLSWTAPVTGAIPTDYVIEYKRSVDSSWSTYSHGRQVTTTITVTGLSASTSYDFRVSASSTPGTGTASATYTVSTSAVSLLLWDASASSANASITNGGIDLSRGVGTSGARATTRKSTGKWYAEIKATAISGVGNITYGVADMTTATLGVNYNGGYANSVGLDSSAGGQRTQVGFSVGTATWSAIYTAISAMAVNGIVMIAFDMDAGKIWIGVNGSWPGSQDPATGSNPAWTFTAGTRTNVTIATTIWAASNTVQIQNTLNYTPPSGFTQLT